MLVRLLRYAAPARGTLRRQAVTLSGADNALLCQTVSVPRTNKDGSLALDICDRGPAGQGYGRSYIYMHGLSSTRQGEKSTALAAHALAEQSLFASFDFSGHGDSAGDLEGLTVPGLLEDAQAVIQYIEDNSPAMDGQEKKHVLVGSSLGGLVAAWYAALFPGANLQRVLCVLHSLPCEFPPPPVR
jgi:pimeloyl-ACP methyl ester carboxylesterase